MITISRAKKYVWLYSFIIFCSSFKIEASEDLLKQTRLKAITTATCLILRKIYKPIGQLTQLRPYTSMQEHPRIAFFSLFGAALTGIILHRSYNTITTYCTYLPTLVRHTVLTSLQKISQQKKYLASLIFRNNPSEDLQHVRRELQTAQERLHTIQAELATRKSQEATRQTEYDMLRQENTHCEQLYKEGCLASSSEQKNLIGILTNLIRGFETARGTFTRECNQFEEQKKTILTDNAILKERCTYLEARLRALNAAEHTSSVQLEQKLESTSASPAIAFPQPATALRRSQSENPDRQTPSPLRFVDLNFGKIVTSPILSYAGTPRSTEELKQLAH